MPPFEGKGVNMGCSHDCSSCSKSDCKDRKDFLEVPKPSTKIKKIIGVVSGKGGVGKSLVTSLLAVASNKKGLKTAIIDADILGPSIPKAFGLNENDRAVGSDDGLFPAITKNGVKIMSINLLLEQESMPVVWRGPVVSGVVKQFYTDVLWKENDIMFIDMPPGTGDVPLTIYQSIPLDGIVVVATPQDLVKMIVSKAVNMANMMAVPIYGIVENMSYIECPTCKEKIYLFGKGKVEEVAKEYNIDYLASLPLNSEITKLVDEGKIESADTSLLDSVISKIMEEN